MEDFERCKGGVKTVIAHKSIYSLILSHILTHLTFSAWLRGGRFFFFTIDIVYSLFLIICPLVKKDVAPVH